MREVPNYSYHKMIPINTKVTFRKIAGNEKSPLLYGKVIGFNEAGEVFIQWTSEKATRSPSGAIKVPTQLYQRREDEVTPVLIETS